ncbi:MAG: superoxide dismutase family protein, partial [Pseudomonadota bacterium]
HGAMSSGKDGSDTMAGMNMTGIESQSEGDEATGMPKMAMKMPPRGDLPPFVFDADGTSATMVMSDALTLDEIRGRSIMLHLGEDKDGKSGPKVACGIIR